MKPQILRDLRFLFSLVVAAVLLVAPRVLRAPEGPAAVCAGGRRPARVMVLLVAPRVFQAPEGPAAREARRPHFVRRRASKPARALRTLRRPSHQRRCVAGVWLGASARSPATAHGHRSRALRSLRRPSHRRRLVADVLLGALLRSQAGSRASTCFLSSVSHAIP